jgi:hypothetical protein
VGSPAQGPKLGAGLSEIRGLVEPNLAADQKLIGANDEGSTKARRNLARLDLGKSKRAIGRIPSLCPAGLFKEAFVKLGRFDPKIDAGSGEQLRPYRTHRCEHQTLSHSCRDGGPTTS